MAGPTTGKLSKFVTFGVLYLAREQARRHTVGLVADNEVPVRRSLELGLKTLGTGRHVEAHDKSMALDKRIAGDRRLDLLARQHVESEVKLLFQLVLPLLDKATGRDDQASLKVTADQQLLDEEASHDRLAGAGIVG